MRLRFYGCRLNWRNIPGSFGKVRRHAAGLVAGQPVGGRAAMWLIVEIAERSAVGVVIQYSASEVALVGTELVPVV